MSGTNKNDFVDVVKEISNVIESIEAYERSQNVNYTDLKDSFISSATHDIVYNKVGYFSGIDTLNDKQLEVAVILFDGLREYLMKKSKINPKRKGK